MPGTVSEHPSVSLSFANNFWGKEDAGVGPLLERMHDAKVSCDELKAFYTARAAIEEEYARKLLNLSRKPLGSSESGTLRLSLDVIRGEVESMGKAHQNIAGQMKTELDEPLSAFAGGMKERRKIVQTGVEKLLKIKTQQTMTVNKARDRYEQDCLKIKGYLAQTHMVMGQEERKNKAKLEKTQIQLSSTSNEYEAAVKVLEETTGKWNRDWKAACDKFQDLEEERIDFMKASLWNFANIASTVCVSDDASCEKVRLSLEDCEVEKDICNFIKECGTGQEIPDPPKFINFCRGDADEADEADEDGNYSVAQFQRTMNPAFRSSSPQPSTFESHHDPANPVAMEQLHKDPQQADNDSTPRGTIRGDPRTSLPSQQKDQFGDIPKVPYNESPYEGMTQFCRPTSGQSTAASPVRPSSRDSQSEYSNPTSFSSVDPASGAQSPVKHFNGSDLSQNDDTVGQKRGFFKSHSPFRRRSKSEKEAPALTPNGRNSTWGPASARNENVSPTKRGSVFGGNRMSASPDPDPVDPRANFQLNIGNNVFDVASPDARNKPSQKPAQDDLDPIAQALAELKGIDKQASVRQSADRYHGIATPAPPSSSGGTSTPVGGMRTPLANDAVRAAQRGTPPPSYDNPSVSRLGAPNPAFTAREMRQTTQQYVNQKQSMFNPSGRNLSSRPPTRGNEEVPRAASPAPPRAASPRPGMYDQQQQPSYRAPSPNPFQAGNNRPRAQSSSPVKPRNDPHGSWGSRGGSPGQQQMPRAASPQPYMPRQAPHPRAASPQPYATRQGPPPRAASPNPQMMRPGSSRGDGMALQLAPAPHDGGYGAAPRARGSDGGRPQSAYYGPGDESNGARQVSTRVRSKSVADPNAMPNGGRFTQDGRPILHYARAMYLYQAAIPEELSFVKGDTLAVLRLQDDGWWEAEVVGKRAQRGLVPSNYLQTM